MQPKKIIVIGSGFGGLAVALRLLAAGNDVTILERREKVGGRAYQLKESGYTFDMGPSLITAPSLFDDLFNLFNKKRKDYLDFVALDPFYRIYFEKNDGGYEKVDYNGDPAHMKRELERLEPGAGEKYDAYFAKIKPIYDAAYKRLGAYPFLTIWDFLKVLPEMLRLDAIRSVVSLVSDFFKTDFANRTYSFNPLYIGVSPYKAPAALGFIPYLEREEGVWFCKGGMYSIIEALANLFTEHGGKIICKAAVEKISTTGRLVTSVEAAGTVYAADAVVSNADVLRTYQMIENPVGQRRSKQLAKKRYSMSLFMFYFGLKKQYREKLAHHTLILGKDYKNLLDEIFDKKVMPTSLSMYLHIPSVTDPTMSPDGCESMYVLVPMPNLSGSVDWNEQTIKKVREWVVGYLEKEFGLEDFSNAIDVERYFIPTDFESSLQSHLGSAFATELNLFQSVYFRQHNRSDEFENLYFVGAGTHPGPGVPGVLLSAECTAKLL